MNVIKIACFFLTIAISCNISNTKIVNNQKMIVRGVARDSKVGAYVKTVFNQTYYIEGLDSWLLINDGDFLGQKLRVTGILILKPFPNESNKKKMKYIRNYQYQLIEK